MPNLQEALAGWDKRRNKIRPTNLSWGSSPVTSTPTDHAGLVSNPQSIIQIPHPTAQNPATTNPQNVITRTKGEFAHDLDQYGYDALYGQRDFQSDVDIWTHIKEKIHPKHKEQQEYIDMKDEALLSGIKGIYETRRSKADIEKILVDYYGDDLKRIESKLDSHGHGFDPLGDLTKNITSLIILAGIAYVGIKYVLPMVRKKL